MFSYSGHGAAKVRVMRGIGSYPFRLQYDALYPGVHVARETVAVARWLRVTLAVPGTAELI